MTIYPNFPAAGIRRHDDLPLTSLLLVSVVMTIYP